MKKILVIQGGGRPHGNTAQLVESFVRGAEDAGNSVEVISLNKYEVKGLPVWEAVYSEGQLQRDCAENQGCRLYCFCFATLLLDDFFKAESIYRTLLLHSRGRPESAAWQI